MGTCCSHSEKVPLPQEEVPAFPASTSAACRQVRVQNGVWSEPPSDQDHATKVARQHTNHLNHLNTGCLYRHCAVKEVVCGTSLAAHRDPLQEAGGIETGLLDVDGNGDIDCDDIRAACFLAYPVEPNPIPDPYAFTEMQERHRRIAALEELPVEVKRQIPRDNVNLEISMQNLADRSGICLDTIRYATYELHNRLASKKTQSDEYDSDDSTKDYPHEPKCQASEARYIGMHLTSLDRSSLRQYLEQTLSNIKSSEPIDEAELRGNIMPSVVATINRLTAEAPEVFQEELKSILTANHVLPEFKADSQAFQLALQTMINSMM